MDIHELKEERIKLERAIAENIQSLVKIFREKTGESIKYISVDVLPINKVGSQEEYIIQNVTCELAF